MRVLTIRGWGALGALLVLAAVVAAALSSTIGSRFGMAPASPAPAALAKDVKRCSHAGQAAKFDPACQAPWRHAREQFLGGRLPGGRSIGGQP